MSLYIHPENQTLLWDIIHKTSLFNELFPPSGSNLFHKEEWFKSIVQFFYKQFPEITTKNELYEINRKTLGYMVKNLKEQLNVHAAPVTSPPPSENGVVPMSYSGIPGEPLSSYSRNYTENKQEFVQKQFQERQREYNFMIETPVPKDVVFEEKIDDEPISNMEELIEQHRKTREEEMQKYAPSMDSESPQTFLKIDYKTNVPADELNAIQGFNPISASSVDKHVSWQK